MGSSSKSDNCHQKCNEAEKGEPVVARDKWGRQIEFFLSLLGYSVGIGNIVRFPYLCLKNGGGAFVIPFFLAHLLCGIPLFILELLLGQFSGLSPFTLWNFCPIFKGIGYSMAAISGLMSIYYNMLIGYCLFYLFSSFTTNVPWQTCGNSWNSDRCWDGKVPLFATTIPTIFSNSTDAFQNSTSSLHYYDITTQSSPIGYENIPGNMTNFSNNTYSALNTTLFNASSVVWASDEFWHHRVLGMSSGIDHLGSLRWELVLCLLGAWVIVFLSLAWGVKWSGKVVYVTATLPYILLTALVIRGCTLEGAAEGLIFYSYPNFRKLIQPETWIEASIQMFYSLGPAWGGLITMASYNPFRHKCMREGIIAPALDMVTALFGGIAIFSIIGFMSSKTGLPVEAVAKSGPGLAFIVYPLALAQLPGAPIWSAVFFLTLITLGIDSQFGTFETVLSGLFDAWPHLRKHNMLVTGIACGTSFLIGLIFCAEGGMYLYQLIDFYSAVITVPLIALFEVIAVFFIYGIRRFSADVKLMLGRPPWLFLQGLWVIATPLILLMVLLVGLIELHPPKYGNYVYPAWTPIVGWLIALSTALPMPVTAIWVVYKTKPDPHPADAPDNSICRFFYAFLSRLRHAVTPNENWQPADPEAREQYKEMQRRWKSQSGKSEEDQQMRPLSQRKSVSKSQKEVEDGAEETADKPNVPLLESNDGMSGPVTHRHKDDSL